MKKCIIRQNRDTDMNGRKGEHVKKVIYWTVFLIIAAALAFAAYRFIQQQQANDQQRLEEYLALEEVRRAQAEQLSSLKNERESVKREIEEIEKALNAAENQVGMVNVLFRGAYREILDSAKGLLDAYDMKGTLLLTESMYPGQEGCLSLENVKALTDAGWDLCVPCMSTQRLEQFIQKITGDGLPVPSALYAYANISDAEIQTLIQQFGFQAVICEGARTLNITETPIVLASYSHVGETETVDKIFDGLRKNPGRICVTVSYTSAGNSVLDSTDLYDASRMKSILNYCAYYGIQVSTVSEMIAADAPIDTVSLTQRLAELNQRLEEIEAEITESTYSDNSNAPK